MPRDIAFCLAEDRADCEIGLRLALLSLRKHYRETPIYVYRPSPTREFTIWVKRLGSVTLIPHRPDGGSEWSCKPQALMPVLAAGHRQAVWLDSDIIVTRNCGTLFDSLDERTLLGAQQPSSLPNQGTRQPTEAWNLNVGRTLPFTLNSSVLRVTKAHLPLLDRWIECMSDPRYIAAQAAPLSERPLHLASDQDVLNALIGASDFAHIPVKVIATGIEIIHAGGALGYSLRERLSGLTRPKPGFIHATSGKPWLWLSGGEYWSQPNFFSWHRRLLQEVSPYVYEARQYRDALDADAGWMYTRSAAGRFLKVLGFNHFALRGLPLTLAATIMDALKKRSQKTQPKGSAAARALAG